VNKVIMLAGGLSAAAAMAVLGSAHAGAEVPDVTGLTYGQAVAILKSSGIKAVFGGATGDDLPESQCVVSQQTPLKSVSGMGARMRLMLDCTLPEGATMPKAPNTRSLVPPGGSVPGGGGARPTPGAGTVTVTPVPIG